MFTEKPSIGNTMKTPISDTGTVKSGMSVARQFCRNTNTTRITSTTASMRVWTISSTPAVMAAVVSSVISCFIPAGKRCSSSAMVFLTVCCTWSAFEPGIW